MEGGAGTRVQDDAKREQQVAQAPALGLPTCPRREGQEVVGGHHCKEVGAPQSPEVRGAGAERGGLVKGTETNSCQRQAERRAMDPRGRAEGRQVDAVGHALVWAEVY